MTTTRNISPAPLTVVFALVLGLASGCGMPPEEESIAAATQALTTQYRVAVTFEEVYFTEASDGDYRGDSTLEVSGIIRARRGLSNSSTYETRWLGSAPVSSFNPQPWNTAARPDAARIVNQFDPAAPLLARYAFAQARLGNDPSAAGATLNNNTLILEKTASEQLWASVVLNDRDGSGPADGACYLVKEEVMGTNVAWLSGGADLVRNYTGVSDAATCHVQVRFTALGAIP